MSKKDWQTKTLNEVCQKTSNITWSKFPNKSFQYIDLSSVSRETFAITESTTVNQDNAPSRAKQIVLTDDIIFGTTRPTLMRVARITDQYNEQLCSTGFCVLRPNESNILPGYIFYFLQTEFFKERMQNLQRGASYPAVSDSDVKSSELPVPPIEEQKRIVGILDEKFESIEKLIMVTEEQIRDVKDLFENRLREIFHNTAKEFGLLPFQDVCRLKSGNTISKSLESDSGDLLYVKVGDMNLPGNETFISTSSRLCNSREIPESHRIPKDSVIFPKRGGAILTNKKRIVSTEIVADLNIMAAIPNDSLGIDYLFYWFKTFKLEEISNGSSILQINNYSFDGVTIPLPPKEVQLKITAELNELSENTKELEVIFRKKIADLEELKKTYLEQAFSGKL